MMLATQNGHRFPAFYLVTWRRSCTASDCQLMGPRFEPCWLCVIKRVYVLPLFSVFQLVTRCYLCYIRSPEGIKAVVSELLECAGRVGIKCTCMLHSGAECCLLHKTAAGSQPLVQPSSGEAVVFPSLF